MTHMISSAQPPSFLPLSPACTPTLIPPLQRLYRLALLLLGHAKHMPTQRVCTCCVLLLNPCFFLSFFFLTCMFCLAISLTDFMFLLNCHFIHMCSLILLYKIALSLSISIPSILLHFYDI